eukprot:6190146-Pleurochrysis_carterae.AAC.3
MSGRTEKILTASKDSVIKQAKRKRLLRRTREDRQGARAVSVADVSVLSEVSKAGLRSIRCFRPWLLWLKDSSGKDCLVDALLAPDASDPPEGSMIDVKHAWPSSVSLRAPSVAELGPSSCGLVEECMHRNVR